MRSRDFRKGERINGSTRDPTFESRPGDLLRAARTAGVKRGRFLWNEVEVSLGAVSLPDIPVDGTAEGRHVS